MMMGKISVRSIYSDVAADIIRRAHRRPGASATRGQDSAITFFVITMGCTLWSVFLILGGNSIRIGRMGLVALSIALALALGALNRQLIRNWVLDKDGHPRTELGNNRISRVAGVVILVGSLALLLVSSIP